MIKALIVEDDDTVRAILKRLLINKFGITSFEANNGEVGLQILQDNVPDIILLDNTMPVMDGLSFLRNIRNDEEFKNIPVLVVTASNDCEVVEQMIELGISDYILKPIDTQITVQRIKKAVDEIKTKKGI